MALLIIFNRQVCNDANEREKKKKKKHENYYVIIIIVTHGMRNVHYRSSIQRSTRMAGFCAYFMAIMHIQYVQKRMVFMISNLNRISSPKSVKPKN